MMHGQKNIKPRVAL